jgi:hypothetical protein
MGPRSPKVIRRQTGHRWRKGMVRRSHRQNSKGVFHWSEFQQVPGKTYFIFNLSIEELQVCLTRSLKKLRVRKTQEIQWRRIRNLISSVWFCVGSHTQNRSCFETTHWSLVISRSLGCWEDNVVKICILDEWTEGVLNQGWDELHLGWFRC